MRGLSLWFALLALLPASDAEAWCRTSSCPMFTGTVCQPAAVDDCGTPIAWPVPCVEFSVQEGASKNVTFAQTEQLLTTAFATWMNVACPGGGSPQILVVEGPPAICDQHEYNQMAGNAHIIVYRDSAWPYEGSSNTLALTTVTFNLDTGQIYDADMELNSADTNFTVGDTNVDFDLLSIVTHETGHFLGMAHSHDMNATMWPVYNEHSTNQRALSPDDIAGICNVYPPGGAICSCDPTPRHGFSAECAAQQSGAASNLSLVCQGTMTTTMATTPYSADMATAPDSGVDASMAAHSSASRGCSVAPGARFPRGHVAAALALLLAALVAARRRRHPAQRG